MGKLKTRRELWLRDHYFTPLEARELSVLPRTSTVIRRMIQQRNEQARAFFVRNARNTASGKWQVQDARFHWEQYLKGFYKRNGLLVKHGVGVYRDNRGLHRYSDKSVGGKHRGLWKGRPNPWAWYRKLAGIMKDEGLSDSSVSAPNRFVRARQPLDLDKGLLLEQRGEKAQGVGKDTIKAWIADKNRLIARSRGARRTQLIQQRARLERLL